VFFVSLSALVIASKVVDCGRGGTTLIGACSLGCAEPRLAVMASRKMNVLVYSGILPLNASEYITKPQNRKWKYN